MPRLKFDLQPIGPYRDTIEEHNAWVRELSERWGREPTECDCGYHVPGMLSLCRPEDRARCKQDVQKRLEFHYRDKHLRGLRKKREFPGPPFDGKGGCRWCGKEIINPKTGKRHATRTWCADGECLHQYNLHTRLESQRPHLLDRDGMGCVLCGKIEGRWGDNGLPRNPDTLRAWGPAWEKRYPADLYVGEFVGISWSCSLEVDHFIALAVAFEAFADDDRRRWFFSPKNLRLLCHDCHKAKTVEDRALLRQCYDLGPEWARATIIDILGAAGLLSTKGDST